MKKVLLTMLLMIALLPSMVLGASEPTLINTFEVDNQSLLFGSSGNPYHRTDIPNAYDKDSTHYYAPTDTQNTNNILNLEVWDSYLAIATWERNPTFNGQWLLEIYNYETGNIIYETAIPNQASCGASAQSAGSNNNQLMYDGAGNLIVSMSYACGSITLRQHAVYDVSNIGFIGQRGQTWHSAPIGVYANSNTENFIVSTTGEVVEFVDGGHKYKINATDGFEYLGAVGTTTLPELYPINLFDKQNNVFVKGNLFSGAFEDFYMIDNSQDIDDYSTPTLIGSVGAGVGEIQDWNRNFLNPEYITSNGNLMIVGGSDYDNFQTSSATLSFTPKFFFERDNIIGVENNKWVYADMTDLTAITEGIGTANIDADQFWRFEDNLIVTYNRTNFEFKIYEVPLPSFVGEEAEGINTPPSKNLDLLGIDNNGRFVFAGEFSDAQGGIIFEALTVGSARDVFEEVNVADIINHNYPEDREFIIPDDGGLCADETTFETILELGDYILEYPTAIDMTSLFGAGRPCQLTHDHATVTQLDSEQIQIRTSVFIDSGDWLTADDEVSSITLKDEDNNILARLIIFAYHQNNNVSVRAIFGDEPNVWLLENEPILSGEETFYDFTFDINFATEEINVTMREALDIDDALAGYNTLLDEENINFHTAGVDSFSDIIYHDIGTEADLWVMPSVVTYDNVAQVFPEYELVDTLEAGETTVIVLRSEESYSFGGYTALLYATDNTLGLNYYENPFSLTFSYDEDVQQLSEQEIQSAISDLLAGANDGFNVIGTIEGDLVTDTLFGYFDQWNIKSTASKFLVGLLMVLLLIGAGGYLGVVTQSPIVSGIGAMFGGLGGLFLVTYWGLFPGWVTFTITLITLVIIANMMRNALTGRGS